MSAAPRSKNDLPTAPATEGKQRSLRDPLAPVIALGQRQLRVGALVGALGTLALHGAPASRAFATFPELGAFAVGVLETVRERLRNEVDIEVDKEPPPPPPPPPPEPEPEPEPQKPPEPPPRAAPEVPEPPPAPAQAAKVITSEPDPEEPVDLTDQGFVTGNADRFAGGITANTGTSTTAVRDVNAAPGGVPGGTGKKLDGPPVLPGRDMSRQATPETGSWNDCGFPAEADIEGINLAIVTLTVTVGPEGRAKSVSVVKDPGFGFGKLARQCALRKRYKPGLDSAGKPLTKTTPPFNIRFTR